MSFSHADGVDMGDMAQAYMDDNLVVGFKQLGRRLVSIDAYMSWVAKRLAN